MVLLGTALQAQVAATFAAHDEGWASLI